MANVKTNAAGMILMPLEYQVHRRPASFWARMHQYPPLATEGGTSVPRAFPCLATSKPPFTDHFKQEEADTVPDDSGQRQKDPAH